MAFLKSAQRTVRNFSAFLNRISIASTASTSPDGPLRFGDKSVSSRPAYTKFIAALPLAVACSSEKLPDIPLPPSVPDVAQNLNALGEPTFASLGLNTYWPSGWYQSLLETLHVNLDLPWWAAIAATTVAIRLLLVPLIIDQRRKLAGYTNVMPRIAALQDRMTKARIANNYIEMMKVSQEMQELMQNNDVNPLNSMKLMVVQVPIFLSVFAGLRGMAQLPVGSMTTGGLGWFADLTVCDPFYILPLYSMTSIFLMFEFGADMSSKGMTPTMQIMMRGFPVVGFFMIMHMPSALLWYWSISNTISIAQALILRSKPVREYLKFPEVAKPPPKVEKKKGFIEGFRQSMDNSKMIAELEARERTDAERWQKAGMSTVPKTFAYDPTKRSKPVLNVKGTVVPDSAKKAAKL